MRILARKNALVSLNAKSSIRLQKKRWRISKNTSMKFIFYELPQALSIITCTSLNGLSVSVFVAESE
jgi:hypothetical protein